MEALTTLTDDALLVEESTMDPLSPLPSFVEMLLVQQAVTSGRSALSAAVAALAASGEGRGGGVGGSSTSVGDGSGRRRDVLRRMGLFLHRLCARVASRYGEEVCALITYAVERRCLGSETYGGGATAAEAVYGLTRSRWSMKPPLPPPSRPGSAALTDDGEQEQEGVSAMLGRGVAADDFAAGKNEANGPPLAKSVKVGSSRGVDEHPEEAAGDSGGYLAPLSDGDRVRSALVAALGPYVKDKLERAFERTRDNMNSERMMSSRNPPTPDPVVRRNMWKLVAREAFVRSYPYVHLAWEGLAFAYQFAYLLGRTAHFTPSLHALGLFVRRVTMEDLQKREERHPTPPGTEKEVTTAKTSADSSPLNAPSTSQPSETTPRPQSQTVATASPNLVRRIRVAAVGGAAALLLVGWAVQVRAELRQRRRRRIADSERRRWRSGRRPRDGVHDDDDEVWSLPPPVPPAIPPRSSRDDGGAALVPLPRDPMSCPMCLRYPRVNPAAAPSGYVFCYRCLVEHVRDAASVGPSSSSSSSSSPSCPVTGVPCPEDRILRLFETHER